MKKVLRLSPQLTTTLSSSGDMPCPFLSRLSSTFIKNYSGKLLKTYGDHCPVMSKQGVTAATAAMPPQVGGCVQQVKPGDNKDDIEVRDNSKNINITVKYLHEFFVESEQFEYETFFAGEIEKKKMDHSYRVFRKVMRDAAKFPAAKEFTQFPKV